jgi:hypothetical protein
MSAATFEVHGLDELARALKATEAAIQKGTARGLYLLAEETMADSKENFVPVDEGILRDSGFVELPVFDGDGVSVRLGYGGAAAAYAVVQHEDLTLNHPNGGEAKFLEKPMLTHWSRVPAVIATTTQAEITRALG